MERKENSVYEAPLARVFELRLEGIICGSGEPKLLDFGRLDYELEIW